MNISSAFPQSGWIQLNSGINESLYSVRFINSNTGLCVGERGIILRTTNGGTNWFQQSIPYQNNLTSLAFTSAFAAYAVGDSALVLKSTDGGNTWYRLSLIPPYNFISVFFINDDLGYVGGDRIDFKSENKIFKTLDGGISWDSIESKDIGSFVKSLFFINSNTGWTTNGYYALNTEAIYKTTNGGINWYYQFNRSPPISSVFFIDTLNGWVGANNSFSVPSIIKTTNGGTNWNGPILGIGYVTNSIYFISKNKGWAGSESRVILATTNGGINWLNQTSYQPGINYRSVYFTDSLTGWVVGDSGIILKTTSGGVLTGFSNASSENPDKYFLSQNYPNPFNPVTNLEFGISKLGFVSLKVYDVLGNEVSILVNENKPQGSYEVEFNGSNFPSGIYFYTLKSGDFKETKRMLLIK